MSAFRNRTLPPRLRDLEEEIKGYALSYGLDFYEVIFEMLTYEEVNMVAAYGGYPNRYPHWRFGMDYEQLSKGYEYGLSKIYEMVINNDPTYAYLLESNPEVDQKLVMAHVYGHGDFFKNNFAFQHTNRKMMDEMANHATRVRRLIDRHGLEKVEDFIDRCLSLENLIDYHSPYIKREPSISEDAEGDEAISGLRNEREYMGRYINPKEYLEGLERKAKEERERKRRFPETPQRDVLLFLLDFAPLEPWEQEVLSIIREEAYYFAPQGMTKIMNEGWASYWHSTIMTNNALRDSELIDYADHHAGTMAMSSGALNPYKIGIELFRDIEQRWNMGRFGKEWEECDSLSERQAWDKKSGLGREKIFEVRRHYNDVTFIDEFLTPEFCIQQKLFVYDYNDKRQTWEIASRQFQMIKERLLHQLTNFGQPIIEVVDANFENRSELLLVQKHDGVDLKLDDARHSLQSLQSLWRRPVNLYTRVDGKSLIMRFDGAEHSEQKAEL